MYQDFLFFPKKPLVLVFVTMDLLKCSLFKGPTLFSNRKAKLEIPWPREATEAHGENLIPQRLFIQGYFSLGG